ncbi:MAG: ATP-grasp domain-containing protein [Ignavibacteria bacterium]|nr:MAG: ATP-grasp domain-containing protein [Ignavibacteria bacterium]
MEESNTLPSYDNLDYDDKFAEWDTSETIDAIYNALSIYHDVIKIEANEEAYIKLKELRPDIVFNVSEGLYGISREAQIPSMLDMLRIPYTGSDPLTLAICLDKARTKEILEYHSIPTPKFKRIQSIEDLDGLALNYPMIVKPVGEGSSKGVFNKSVVENNIELLDVVGRLINKYEEDLIVEEFLTGREFTVAIMGNGNEAIALPIVEISFNELPEGLKPLYSFEAKWLFDSPDNPLDIFECPANLPEDLSDRISKTALEAYKVLNCKDWSRIDVRLDQNDVPHIIEVNPLPGVLPNPDNNSCYPKAARTYGMDYDTMINKVLYFAAKRHGLIIE